MTARGSASNTASSTSPRSSPSTCSGRGRRSGRRCGRRRGGRQARTGRPPREVSVTSNRGSSRARTEAGATTSSPRSNEAPRATRGPACAPAYVYGSQFATSTNAARPAPSISRAGGKWPRRDARSADRRAHESDVARTTPVGAPAVLVDAADEIGVEADTCVEARTDVRSRGRARSACSSRARAAVLRATGSRPSPSARGRTLVPPPGRNPSGTWHVTPFSTSL